jgi:outer membrane lipoprotein SlyB
MKLKILVAMGVLLLVGTLSGCTPDISPMNYGTAQTGQAAPTVRGVIIAATPVRVSGGGQSAGVGTLAGAVAGGAAGSAIGGGARANIIGGVGGAVLGGVLGNAIQQNLSTQTGIQYQVKQRNGGIVTVTQGVNPPLSVGQHVFVIYGSQTRVIPDTTMAGY